MYKEPEPAASEEFFAQIRISRAAPGPAPETFGEYKKSESSSGVIAMMEDMAREVEDDNAEAKRDEEEAQKDYEQARAPCSCSRCEDVSFAYARRVRVTWNELERLSRGECCRGPAPVQVLATPKVHETTQPSTPR